MRTSELEDEYVDSEVYEVRIVWDVNDAGMDHWFPRAIVYHRWCKG